MKARPDVPGRLLVSLVLLAIGLTALFATPAAAAAPCDPPIANAIVCENSKPGAPQSQWDIADPAGDPSIQGFATDISVDQGQTVHFKIDTASTAYHLDIYRMGYYGGDGARKVATVTPSASLPQNQPPCLNDAATGLVDCGNWADSASWAVPADAVSGIYFAKLIRDDAPSGGSHIMFVVRDDDGHSDLLFQTSDTTWQAYNQYGGNSLYTGSSGVCGNRACKVSYNRPITTRGTGAEDSPFNAEYPMVRWLERNGYDVSYFTGVDADRRGSEILEHKAYLSVGHDEYWSGAQRANVEAARAAGVNLAFFSGNEVFWKTRWENSIDGSGTDHRTLVSYKETHANAKIDPNSAWTGTWRDPRFSPPADGGRPENALSGNIFTVNSGTTAIEVPAADGKMRFWRNTSIASLAPNETATLAANTLGYEWDEDLDNGFRPAGLIDLSSTTRSGVEVLQDYGSNYASGTATHHLTLYRTSSGALVFGAGTVQWSWGLDGEHDRGVSSPDPRMQQATVNLLADMGAQPATLQGGLVAASASTDHSAPTATISTPNGGANFQSGSPITISGTATDAGGGQVGGVEVSTDNGNSWHPAPGRASWSYRWTPGTVGAATIRARAVDDSGNLQAPGAQVSINVVQRPCPCSIWDDSASGPAADDPSAVEVGVKFRSDQPGYITGLRFYKTAGNTGTHVGRLWTAGGTQLAEATFSGESASGWQQVSLDNPVAINADTTYIASYHAPNGNYAASNGYFASAGVDAAPLHALGGPNGPNGVYKYGPSGGLFSGGGPDSFSDTNYWVDVVFASNEPPTAVNDQKTVAEDSGATAIDVRANDTDPDGGPKTISSATQPAHGTVTVAPDGSNLSYAPNPDYCNTAAPTDDFTYTLNGGSTATVAVTVNCVDDPPHAVNDQKTVAEDSGTTTIDVRANDTDPDGGPKTISSATQPAHGTVTVAADGSNLSYRPNPDYCNSAAPTDDFTYTLNGGSTATVAVSVNCVDDPPHAVNDQKTVAEDSGTTTIDVRANDTDPDGGPKTISSATQPAHGTVTVAADGSNLSYRPNPDYCNSAAPTDDFTYTLNGGSTATVAVSVNCVDDPPTAVNDQKTVDEDSGTTTIDVRANDTDPDGGPKTISSATQPAHGTVTVAPDGSNLSYAPNPDYCNTAAPTDDFTYTLNGGSTATVAVTVNCLPELVDRPTITASDPPSPSADNNPKLKGTLGVGNPTLVEIFTNANCSGAAASSGDATQFTGAGIAVAVPSDATTALSARAKNVDGDTSNCSNSVSYTEDSTPPETTIDSGPSGPTNNPSPSFSFHSSEAGSSFACRFDSAAFAPCSGPGATHTPPSPLSDGSHSFEVRATDAAANTDPTAAARSFSVDTQAPRTSIQKHPPSEIKATGRKAKASFRFASDPGVTFKCKLDSASFARCQSPKVYMVKPGKHTFSVKATDRAQNTGRTVSFSFKYTRKPR